MWIYNCRDPEDFRPSWLENEQVDIKKVETVDPRSIIPMMTHYIPQVTKPCIHPFLHGLKLEPFLNRKMLSMNGTKS